MKIFKRIWFCLGLFTLILWLTPNIIIPIYKRIDGHFFVKRSIKINCKATRNFTHGQGFLSGVVYYILTCPLDNNEILTKKVVGHDIDIDEIINEKEPVEAYYNLNNKTDIRVKGELGIFPYGSRRDIEFIAFVIFILVVPITAIASLIFLIIGTRKQEMKSK